MYNPEHRKEDFEAMCSQVKQELGEVHYNIIQLLTHGVTKLQIS